ncbi:MAG: Mur ligase family protein, partial [bacterium]|nr:Mur ligase family protein [bacterium]
MKKLTPLQRYDNAVAFLETLPKINKDNYMESLGSDKGFYLRRLRYLLDLVGNPENFIQNYIHVGGTSGKGTVTKTLTENLLANRRKAGSYMSPHITTTTERFSVNGKLISMNSYSDLIEWIKPALHTCLVKSPYGLPSYFEIQVAIALEFFRREKCEWVVLEVGCGGEFDATNVIPQPKAAVITNIGLDHMHLLGETKAEIAETKSGIIKKGSLVFTGEKSPRLQHIIKDVANKQGATLQIVEGGNEELVEAVLHGLGFEKKVSHPPLPGRFEI